jgi:hypothetical protein
MWWEDPPALARLQRELVGRYAPTGGHVGPHALADLGADLSACLAAQRWFLVSGAAGFIAEALLTAPEGTSFPQPPARLGAVQPALARAWQLLRHLRNACFHPVHPAAAGEVGPQLVRLSGALPEPLAVRLRADARFLRDEAVARHALDQLEVLGQGALALGLQALTR